MAGFKTAEGAMEYVAGIQLCFDSISLYREVLQKSAMKKLVKLFKYMSKNDGQATGFIRRYNEFYYALMRDGGKSLWEYVEEEVLYDENAFTKLSINREAVSKYIIEAAAVDLKALSRIAAIDPKDLKGIAFACYTPSYEEKLAIKNLGEWYPAAAIGENIKEELPFHCCEDWSQALRQLRAWHIQRGSGVFARFNGFLWQGGAHESSLRGIEKPDPIRLSDLIGYEEQRRLILANTDCFLEGLPANNVLLYGDRGTGKSATVKALLNEYHERGLRIIELPKEFVRDLPAILRIIKDKPLKFIIFIDDLAFGDNEESYTALKAVLEGGLESRVSNIVIYATSNRRHLVKEKFSDRAGLFSDNPEDEILAADTIQEKLSLSDRFGITITFSSPDKEQYLGIIKGLAQRRGLDIELSMLEAEAMKWELRYNGKSPRTARQFIDYMEGTMGL